ncbi:MAG: hypothetical protein LQ337_003876 [Flavoplaca oasis]|nr:MAG: hypothetical protein LQ337_003876 [Flavoplaca oasis]
MNLPLPLVFLDVWNYTSLVLRSTFLWSPGSQQGQQLKDKEEPSISDPPSVIPSHASKIHSQVDPGSFTRPNMPMSMLPIPERNPSARAAPDFRQNQMVAAETQSVPNPFSKRHPQVNSPSESPTALVLPPGHVQQSEVAPNVSL